MLVMSNHNFDEILLHNCRSSFMKPNPTITHNSWTLCVLKRPQRMMLSHRNSYSAGSASAAYGYRSAGPPQPNRSSTGPIREGYSAEYEVRKTPSLPRSSLYLYKAPWPIYALDWVKWPHSNLTNGAAVALGSFMEESSNKVHPSF